MDWVDTWLNRQVGWRRAVLAWLQVCPVTIGLGCVIWGWYTPGVQGPGLGFAEVVGWSLLAAVPLAGVVVRLLRGRPVGPFERPVFSWCMYAGMLCYMAAVVLNVVTDQQPYWSHVHRVIGLMSLLLYLAGAGLWVEAGRRRWRFASGRLAVGRSRADG